MGPMMQLYLLIVKLICKSSWAEQNFQFYHYKRENRGELTGDKITNESVDSLTDRSSPEFEDSVSVWWNHPTIR
jgi:hypothetical protein